MGLPGGSLPLIQHPSPWASCAAMRGCGLSGPRARPLGASPLVTIAGSKWINASRTRDTKSRGPNTNFTKNVKKEQGTTRPSSHGRHQNENDN
jgi:hypothetical protein